MLFKKLAGAVLIAAFLLSVPPSARAQTLTLPTISSGYSFDAYRAAAITAGVVVGAVVATIVTDGLIIPVLATATGGAAGTGTGAGFISGTLRLFGALSGGMYADTLYLNR